uniref:F-box domain-containing protein n=1 Tax=Mycena chlorophos TaxID=658473 RepID=A0ABQ0KVX4_MYCCL|nr:predicted protein [Mycena chlorophos]
MAARDFLALALPYQAAARANADADAAYDMDEDDLTCLNFPGLSDPPSPNPDVAIDPARVLLIGPPRILLVLAVTYLGFAARCSVRKVMQAIVEEQDDAEACALLGPNATMGLRKREIDALEYFASAREAISRIVPRIRRVMIDRSVISGHSILLLTSMSTIVEQRIKSLRAELSELEASQAQAHHWTHLPFRAQDGTCPISKLPAELASEIFLYAVRDTVSFTPNTLYRFKLEIARYTAVCLSQVCRFWRATALGTHRLWSFIAIDVGHVHTKRPVDLIRLWAERSGSLPLHINLSTAFLVPESKGSSDEEDMEEHQAGLSEFWAIFHVLCEYSARWGSLEVDPPNTIYPSLLRRLPSALPLLRSLTIKCRYTAFFRDGALLTAPPSEPPSLQAPSLRYFFWNNLFTCPPLALLGALTTLKFDRCGKNLGDICQILTLTLRLHTLVCDFTCLISDEDLSAQPHVTLSTLHSLHLRTDNKIEEYWHDNEDAAEEGTEQRVTAFLDHFTFPELCELVVFSATNRTFFPGLTSLINRSNCIIRNLDINLKDDHDLGDFGRFLSEPSLGSDPRAPQLESLAIRGINKAMSAGESNWLPWQEYVDSVVTVTREVEPSRSFPPSRSLIFETESTTAVASLARIICQPRRSIFRLVEELTLRLEDWHGAYHKYDWERYERDDWEKKDTINKRVMALAPFYAYASLGEVKLQITGISMRVAHALSDLASRGRAAVDAASSDVNRIPMVAEYLERGPFKIL